MHALQLHVLVVKRWFCVPAIADTRDEKWQLGSCKTSNKRCDSNNVDDAAGLRATLCL